jgi:hypothetical protein
VGDRHDGAGEAHQELLQPLDAFGVQVVGGLVEQQHVGLRQQQAAERHAALLAAREVVDLRVPRRQAQRVGGDLELRVERVRFGRGEQLLELLLLGGELVEVGVGLGVLRVHLLEALLRLEHFPQAFLDRFAHGVAGLELRLLRQVADADSRHRRGRAFVLLVEARHDLQDRRLAGAIEPQEADLGARVEGERYVLDDLALGRNNLAHADHRVNELGHGKCDAGSGPARRVLRGRRKDTRNMGSKWAKKSRRDFSRRS